MQSNGGVEDYIKNNAQWEKEFTALRKIILSTALQETVKWRFLRT